jgi:3-dehydroquinate dehydratase type I
MMVNNKNTLFDSICASIREETFDDVLSALISINLAEIRLDLSRLTISQIKMIFSSEKQLIATCREGFYSKDERLELLVEAINAGAAFVDIEMESDEDFRATIAKHAKLHNCKLIISYHNFNETPSLSEMCDIVNTCIKQGADVVKLATMAKNKSDAARVLSLYDKNFDADLVAFAMGKTGFITRVACIFLGAPWTYAAFSRNKPTADGQIYITDFRYIINDIKSEIE